ncbi:alpha/beta hydrolase [Paenibacillus soyae]|uniref:Alpha/beta hydrolase-fold protein n=1 Tax=Paenibacillus soyae TaxID=2969249 RepID=A0A9X2MVX0_9BACL|nr:alpha/beta hydrolase-fold protein [Paenibacillus soyae]MCR2806806.1 alpha/beta hydrolase-fold protein [Paenibacillus soyae]
MAMMQISFFSASMKREVTFSALLPLDQPEKEREAGKPLKSLYLLHGYCGSHTDWISFSRIRELSDRYRIAVFMPSGENRFYLDDEESELKVGEYVGRELVEFTRRMFPISREREDTYIGGLSMGGYGALRNGLYYAETFGRIIALSSAIISYHVAGIKPGQHNGIAGYGYYRSVFGDLEQVMGSDKDPEELVRRLKTDGSNIPEIYMACGTEDFLLDVNARLHRFLMDEGVEHTYKETGGAHTWDFWNEKIGDALEWSVGEPVR